jgi:putative membrane protein
VALAPDMAEAYNGQQGDVWDAHKDMTFAVVGAMLAASGCALWRTARRQAATRP